MPDYFTLRLYHQVCECVLRGLSFKDAWDMSIDERAAFLAMARS